VSKNVPADIEIAREAELRPIAAVGEDLGIPGAALVPYGHTKAKIDLDFIAEQDTRPGAKLILVTGMTPTPAGEGKTTTSVGLCDGLNRIGVRALTALREPSLGPCFGMKGGAAGGGYAQVVPMEDINLHFTGDLHAITSAHNLLAALIDNHINWCNTRGIDIRRVSWRRVLDMNDRALREINVGLGGLGNGYPREDGFDITVASEVMAILCLADGLTDLRRRLGNIVVARTRKREPVTAEGLEAAGAMTTLLRDALMPNLVQTLEGNPAIIHGGPFANIAHGCSSVIATKAGLRLADYVVTEAGFGADLGAEKFFNIKCRKAGLKPEAAVVVATLRALKMHGGVALSDLAKENPDAVRKGCANLVRHVRNVKSFGVPVIVAVNGFSQDTQAERQVLEDVVAEAGARAVPCTHWADGGAGAEELARAVVDLTEGGSSQFTPLYEDDLSLWKKINTVATRIYGADEAIADKKVRDQLRRLEKEGFGHFPICMAKTQYSFSTDPKLLGAPSHHAVPVREVRLAAGAEFVVAICGEIMTMPGLPRVPAANHIGLDAEGRIEGLF
jgi:formate--tetrahydrofolate ligase